MFSRVLGDPEEIPVPSNRRFYTDCICCVITAVLAIAMFVFAILTYTNNGQDNNHYFDINSFLVTQNTGDITRHDFQGFKTVLFWTAILSLGLGLLWMTIVHLIPSYSPKIAVLLAFISCVVIAVFTFLSKSSIFSSYNWLRYVIAGIAIFTALILLIYLCCYQNELRFQGIFLSYSTRFLYEKPFNFLLILLFLIFTLGLVALCLFQHVAFSRKYRNNNNFFDFSNPSAWGILNIIEFLWGLRFLQDAFIFIISGNAVDWYWDRDGYGNSCLGFGNILSKHWGTVVAGSLLNLLFKIPLLLLELLICHPTGCCNKCGNSCYDGCLHRTIDLIRTDSYAFTNMFGTSYCDSSRHCRNLCLDFPQFQSSQSPLRNYRIVVQIFLTCAGFVGSYLIFTERVIDPRLWFIAELFIVIIGITYYFGSIHASAAEGLQVSTMVERQLMGEYNYMLRCLPSIRNNLQTLGEWTPRDGNC